MIAITIDGPSGSGKSTVADVLAQKLGFNHLNTGALYRAVTYGCLQAGIRPDEDDKISNYIANCGLNVKFVGGDQKVYLGDQDVTPYLRQNEISVQSPLYSVSPSVRYGLTDFSRKLSKKMNIILDGRDSGSFVLPDADYKFYLDASVTERAHRRQLELKAKGESVDLDTLVRQLTERDEFDKHKKIAPLVVPENAIIIDNTNLNLEQTAEEMMKYIKIGK